MYTQKSPGFTGSSLKIIAMITMLIDHTTVVLLLNGVLPDMAAAVLAGHSHDYLPVDYQVACITASCLRLIGRLAFPLYAFLLVEGFFHTGNFRNYALRIGMFALLSEVLFDLALNNSLSEFSSQNTLFTLFIGLLVLGGMRSLEILPPEQMPFRLLVPATGMMMAEFFRTDYGAMGILLITLLYLFRHDRKKQSLTGALCMAWTYTAPLAFLLTHRYNGERGTQLPKYLPYLFYPAHLVLLILIRYLVL